MVAGIPAPAREAGANQEWRYAPAAAPPARGASISSRRDEGRAARSQRRGDERPRAVQAVGRDRRPAHAAAAPAHRRRVKPNPSRSPASSRTAPGGPAGSSYVGGRGAPLRRASRRGAAPPGRHPRAACEPGEGRKVRAGWDDEVVVQRQHGRTALLVASRTMSRTAASCSGPRAPGDARGSLAVAGAVKRDEGHLRRQLYRQGEDRNRLLHPAAVRAELAQKAPARRRFIAPHVVVAGNDGEPPGLRPRGEELCRALELGLLAGQRHVPGDDEVVDLLLLKGLQDLLQQLHRMAIRIHAPRCRYADNAHDR